MTFHKLLVAAHARELAAKAVACCRPTTTPAKQLRLPITSRATAPTCC